MSNNIDFKRMCIDLRGQLDRVTAERDAALAQLEESRVDCEANKHEREVVCANYEVLKQRLTAADERALVMEGLLRDINDAPGGSQFKKHIEAALKPEDVPTQKVKPTCH